MNQPCVVALKYVQAGISCIPIKLDGSKSPSVTSWQEYQKRLPTEEEIKQWFTEPRGIGVIGGAVSGNLECIDIERHESFDEWRQLVDEAMPGLTDKLVISTTPGGKYDSCGYHIRYRVDGDCFGCQKLAKLDKGNLLAELKGEGGYALAPGGDVQAHPSGNAYTNVQGRLSELPTISMAERDILIAKAIELNQYEEPDAAYHPQAATEAGDRPGDKFNAKGDFSFLTNYGWKLLGGSEGKHYWKRPGKDTQGISATTGFCRGKDGTPRLYVFSTNATPFQDNKYYSPFSAYTLLKHNGDWKASSKEIAQQLGITSGKVTIGLPPAEVATADGEIQEQNDATIERALFPVGVFPEALQHVIEEQARTIPAPKDTVGCLMLGVASIGIGNTRKIRLRKNWTEPPSLYIVVVAPPGQGKTPVMQQLDKPMMAWQDALNEQYKSQMADYKEAKRLHEEAKKAGQPSTEPPRPKYQHVFTTDATTEKLAEILHDQPRGVGVNQDEVSALVQGMNQYKQGGKGRDRQFYLSAWSSSPIKVDRKGDEGVPLWVKHPVINIIGGIQPEMLGALKDELGREDGFVHRFLFTFPYLREMRYWDGEEINERAIQVWKDCFGKLTTLAQWHDPQDGENRPFVCLMTTEAIAAWKAWYDRTIDSMRDISTQFIGPYHKLIAYAARLSLVMQMLYWATGELSDKQIDAKAIHAGCALADYFAAHMKLVFTRLHNKPDDVHAEELVEMIQKNGGTITVRELMRSRKHRYNKASNTIKLLQDLEDRGYGKYYEGKGENGGPVRRWFKLKEGSQNDENG